MPSRREDENETLALDERRKTRDAKGKEKEAKRLPAIARPIPVFSDTEEESQSDNGSDAQRIKPKSGRRVKMTANRDQIPEQVTPEYPAPK